MKKWILIILTSIATTFSQSAKFDWVGSISSNLDDEGRIVVTDHNGDIVVAGIFHGTTDFDFGPLVSSLTCDNNFSTYIAKYTSSGSLLWAKKFSSSNTFSSNEPGGIVIDNANNIIITGNYLWSIDADPGLGNLDFTSAGGRDIFIVKLDENGNLIWGKTVGATSSDIATGVEIDNANSVYISGYFQGIADFDPDAGMNIHTSSGWQSGFLLKLKSDGTFRWVNTLLGTEAVHTKDISINHTLNEIIIVGEFSDTADFDPTSSINNITSNGYIDLFYQRIDTSGNVLNTLRLGGSNMDLYTDITYLNNGDKIWAGSYNSVMDLDPGVGVSMSTSGSTFGNSFIIKLDINDNLINIAEFVGSNGSTSNSFRSIDITNDITNGIYWLGSYYGSTADFDPSSAGSVRPSIGSYSNTFILKLDTSFNFEWVKVIDGNYISDSKTIEISSSNDIYITGYFTDTIDFDPSDSAFALLSIGENDAYLLKLESCVPTTNFITVDVCSSYLTPSGNTSYFSSGLYTDFLTSSTGCDSIINIQLNVLNTNNTINPTICTGDTYSPPSGINTYSTTGTYYDTIPNAYGCDSIIQINLIVVNISTSIMQNPTNLLSQQLFATYQWIDCDNGNIAIVGETARDFYPTSNGNYAVIITYNGCVDTSDCTLFEFVGLENQNEFSINIFPNPANNILTIQSPSLNITGIELVDISGRSVYYSSNNQPNIDITNLANGIYSLIVSANGKKRYFKVIIN